MRHKECTYCGQGHDRSSCPLWASRLAKVGAIGFVALLMAGCAPTPVDPKQLHLPSAQLMEPCEDPVDIPKCEAEAKCRTKYYGVSRSQYAACSNKATRLQNHARIVSSQGVE